MLWRIGGRESFQKLLEQECVEQQQSIVMDPGCILAVLQMDAHHPVYLPTPATSVVSYSQRICCGRIGGRESFRKLLEQECVDQQQSMVMDPGCILAVLQMVDHHPVYLPTPATSVVSFSQRI